MMIFKGIIFLFCTSVVLSQFVDSTSISYNQPNLSSCAQWNHSAITFMNGSDSAYRPNTIFIDRNNTIYVTNVGNQSIYQWRNGSTNPTSTISYGAHGVQALFVSTNGDIYISSGPKGQINKWIPTTETIVTIRHFGTDCFNIFIDRNDKLYCAMAHRHQIVATSLRNSSNTTTIVAGTGVSGSANDMLHFPSGIFVDTNFDLYVADTYNNRVLLFFPGKREGVIVAGSSSDIQLNHPTAVVIDGNNHIYIVDSQNNRIVASGRDGFRCVVGCSGASGSSSDKLFSPRNIAFDTYGNIYVSDSGNYRVQKFLLSSNECHDIPPVVVSAYSSKITTNSSKHGHKSCLMSNYYYEALQLNVTTAGIYTLQINSSIKTHTYTYLHNFNPDNPGRNLISENNNQLSSTDYFDANESYVLVITTPINNENMQGAFSLTVSGPNRIHINRIGYYRTIFQSLYSSKLTEYSPKYSQRTCDTADTYYEAIEIKVNTTGYYIFSSINSVDTNGSLFKSDFNPYNPRLHVIVDSSKICPNNQFKMTAHLYSNITYVLVVTASNENTVGPFSVLVSGPNNVTFNRIGLQSMYSSSLTMNSQRYARMNQGANYYYETIQIRVGKSNLYSFDSKSGIMLSGYIYEKSFDASSPDKNLLARSNFHCESYQFGFAVYLQANITYVFVMTTFDPYVQGPFTLFASGPNNITLNRFIYNTTQGSSTTKPQTSTQYWTTIKTKSSTRSWNATKSKTTLIKPQIFITIIMAGFIQMAL